MVYSMVLIYIIIVAHECYAIKEPLRIYGGNDAKSEEYPFVVRIEVRISILKNNILMINNQHLCTASALSPVWLVSAAHCLEIRFPNILKEPTYIVEEMVIRYGHVGNVPWAKDSFSEVLHTIMHPLYMNKQNSLEALVLRHDIGLLKTSPMKIESFMKISAVDYKTVYGHEAVLAGYGRTVEKYANNIILTADTLTFMKPLQLLKVIFTKCHYNEVLTPALCLTSKCGEASSVCPGDSGGPVIHPSGLLGVIVSGRSMCLGLIGEVSPAGTVIPLSPYIEWIYSYVNA